MAAAPTRAVPLTMGVTSVTQPLWPEERLGNSFKLNRFFAKDKTPEPRRDDFCVIGGGEHERNAHILKQFGDRKHQFPCQIDIKDSRVDFCCLQVLECLIDPRRGADDDGAEFLKLAPRLLGKKKFVLDDQDAPP